jgi:SAM-dependent methyltransferase
MRYFEDLYTTFPRAYGELPSEAARQLAKILKKGAKVVDIGCGYGRDSIFLANEGFEVTGIDTSRRGIMAAQLWAREKGVEVTFMNRDLMESRLPERSFDCLLCVNTIEFLDARKRSKSGHAIWKLAAEGAHIGLMVHSTEDPDLRQGKGMGDNTWEVMPGLQKHFFTEREIRSIFPDYKQIRMEVITVTEQVPEKRNHRYWLFIGQRP